MRVGKRSRFRLNEVTHSLTHTHDVILGQAVTSQGQSSAPELQPHSRVVKCDFGQTPHSQVCLYRFIFSIVTLQQNKQLHTKLLSSSLKETVCESVLKGTIKYTVSFHLCVLWSLLIRDINHSLVSVIVCKPQSDTHLFSSFTQLYRCFFSE